MIIKCAYSRSSVVGHYDFSLFRVDADRPLPSTVKASSRAKAFNEFSHAVLVVYDYALCVEVLLWNGCTEEQGLCSFKFLKRMPRMGGERCA
jgi:hypothetical protein